MLVVVTRLPFMSSMLYHLDSAQFALALEHYDVTVHQPHPPGYFLYVMLGRLFHLFVEDANRSYTVLNIIFSGLAVSGLYHIGKELYDKKTGIAAAIVALVSPTLWFHGEVALSYASDAFFSVALAVVCWKIYRGDESYVWPSAIILAISGGVRQNTSVFLFPFWIYCLRGVGHRKMVLSFCLFGVTSLAWFLPMVVMSGGWDVYWRALGWIVSPEAYSLARAVKFSLQALPKFTVDGMRAGLFVIILGAYILIRSGSYKKLDRRKTLFLAVWMLSPVISYMITGVHPRNAGYALLFLPPLFVLAAASARLIQEKLPFKAKNIMLMPIWTLLIGINIYIFHFGNTAVSLTEIRQHDKLLARIVAAIESFDPLETVIISDDNLFYGYNELMYYLPLYRVYKRNPPILPGLKTPETFLGKGRRTFFSEVLLVDERTSGFCALLIKEQKKKTEGLADVRIDEITPGLYLVSGPLLTAKRLFPDLEIVAARRSG